MVLTLRTTGYTFSVQCTVCSFGVIQSDFKLWLIEHFSNSMWLCRECVSLSPGASAHTSFSLGAEADALMYFGGLVPKHCSFFLLISPCEADPLYIWHIMTQINLDLVQTELNHIKVDM